MPDKYSTYQSFPGRQHYVTVVPRSTGPIFFEGVQSIDAASNTNEASHGQYGFKSDVLISKTYLNTSGQFALKDFNNASFVFRAMTGVEPRSTFIFDPARLELVDVFSNVWSADRTRVMRSTWFVDYMPAITQNSTLDDIETNTVDYTAIRKIDFEGKQIICQAFTGTQAGDYQFTLVHPAIIDPTVQTSVAGANGVTTGVGRHELCPIQFLLRVWVGDQILDDPDDAQVTTVTGLNGLVSTVTLKVPVPKDDTMVKVMWLAEGTDTVAQEGVTSAPVIVNTAPNIVDPGAGSPKYFDGELKVYFSKMVDPAAIAALTPADFELRFALTGGGTATMVPTAVAAPTDVVTSNVVELDFSGATSTPASMQWESPNIAWLSYKGSVLQDADGYVTPPHTLELAPF